MPRYQANAPPSRAASHHGPETEISFRSSRTNRRAVSRAVAVETTRGWRISKDKQSHKIDVVVALAMAALAALQGSSDDAYSSMMWVSNDAYEERPTYRDRDGVLRARIRPPPLWMGFR
jgi:phage terminase large subunit-like protein